jgi:hypothetical protein
MRDMQMKRSNVVLALDNKELNDVQGSVSTQALLTAQTGTASSSTYTSVRVKKFRTTLA